MIFADRRRLSMADPLLSYQPVNNVIEPIVSTTANGLIAIVRYAVRHTSIKLLIALRSVVSFGRALLFHIEQRFSRLIDAVRGRGPTPGDRHRGSVSFFLEQIKDYKDEMSRRANIRS